MIPALILAHRIFLILFVRPPTHIKIDYQPGSQLKSMGSQVLAGCRSISYLHDPDLDAADDLLWLSYDGNSGIHTIIPTDLVPLRVALRYVSLSILRHVVRPRPDDVQAVAQGRTVGFKGVAVWKSKYRRYHS